jgi:hypothetical protein
MVPAIKKRLVQQLKDKGKSTEAAYAIAQSALRKSGNVDASGKATAKGKKRGAMTPAQRSNDRAAKYNGGNASDYKYKASNNTSLKINKSR